MRDETKQSETKAAAANVRDGKKKKAPAKKAAAKKAAAKKSPVKRARTKKAMVGAVIKQIEARLDKDELKPTVGDLIRLIQLEKELENEQPRKVTVSWVDHPEGEKASG